MLLNEGVQLSIVVRLKFFEALLAGAKLQEAFNPCGELFSYPSCFSCLLALAHTDEGGAALLAIREGSGWDEEMKMAAKKTLDDQN